MKSDKQFMTNFSDRKSRSSTEVLDLTLFLERVSATSIETIEVNEVIRNQKIN